MRLRVVVIGCFRLTDARVVALVCSKRGYLKLGHQIGSISNVMYYSNHSHAMLCDHELAKVT